MQREWPDKKLSLLKKLWNEGKTAVSDRTTPWRVEVCGAWKSLSIAADVPRSRTAANRGFFSEVCGEKGSSSGLEPQDVTTKRWANRCWRAHATKPAVGRLAIRRRCRFISAASPAPILNRAFRIASVTGSAPTPVPDKPKRTVRRTPGVMARIASRRDANNRETVVSDCCRAAGADVTGANDDEAPLRERAAAAASAELRGERTKILGATGQTSLQSLIRARRVPDRLSVPHVMDRLEEGFRTLSRVPMAVRPRGYVNSMPMYVHDRADLNSQLDTDGSHAWPISAIACEFHRRLPR